MLATIFLWHHNKLLNNQDSVSYELAYVHILGTPLTTFFIISLIHFIKCSRLPIGSDLFEDHFYQRLLRYAKQEIL